MQLFGPYRSSTVAFPQRFGVSGDDTEYYVKRNAAVAAVRRNDGVLYFPGAPSDLAGFVWQDSAGTTPATGTDPIGLLLDRSYGVPFGSELVPAVTAPNWTLGTGVSISGGQFVSAGLGIAGSVAASPSTAPTVTLGKTYRVTFTVAKTSGGDISLGIGGAVGTTRGASGTYTELLTATSTGTLNVLSRGGGGFVGTFGNISAVEVLSIPALQPTAANKPTLELQPNGYNVLNSDGANDALLLSSPVVTSLAQDFTMIAVCRRPTGTPTCDLVQLGNSGSTLPMASIGYTGTTIRAFVRDLSGTSRAATTPYGVEGDWQILRLEFASGIVRLYVNGVLIGSAGSWTPVATTFNVSVLLARNIGGTVSSWYPGKTALLALLPVVDSGVSGEIERFAALLSGAAYA